MRCGNGNGKEKVAKRAQCSTGVQNAQARVVLMVTIVSTRVFPRSSGKAGKVFGDNGLRRNGTTACGFVIFHARWAPAMGRSPCVNQDALFLSDQHVPKISESPLESYEPWHRSHKYSYAHEGIDIGHEIGANTQHDASEQWNKFVLFFAVYEVSKTYGPEKHGKHQCCPNVHPVFPP